MRIPWTTLGVVAVAGLWAASATAQYVDTGPLVDLTNHTTRPIVLRGEDSGCTNPGASPLGSAQASTNVGASCFVDASTTTSKYFTPANDLTGQLSFVGASSIGSNTFMITIPQAAWGTALQVTLGMSGATLSTNTDFELLFDTGTGTVAPNPGAPQAPNYWTATASALGLGLALSGVSDPTGDLPFWGTPVNPSFSTTASGSCSTTNTAACQFFPPLTFSCSWAAANDPNSPPSGTTRTLFGPGFPGAGICNSTVAQPGFITTGPFANAALTYYQFVPIIVTALSEAGADAAWTSVSWRMNELTAGTASCYGGALPNCVDSDSDQIPDQLDDCPFTANNPVPTSNTQADKGGVGVTAPPDGIGDACQCGDASNDGIVTGTDATLISRAAVHLAPFTAGVTALPGFAKCDVNANGTCDGTDATIVKRATVGLAPAIKQGCPAATP